MLTALARSARERARQRLTANAVSGQDAPSAGKLGRRGAGTADMPHPPQRTEDLFTFEAEPVRIMGKIAMPSPAAGTSGPAADGESRPPPSRGARYTRSIRQGSEGERRRFVVEFVAEASVFLVIIWVLALLKSPPPVAVDVETRVEVTTESAPFVRWVVSEDHLNVEYLMHVGPSGEARRVRVERPSYLHVDRRWGQAAFTSAIVLVAFALLHFARWRGADVGAFPREVGSAPTSRSWPRILLGGLVQCALIVAAAIWIAPPGPCTQHNLDQAAGERARLDSCARWAEWTRLDLLPGPPPANLTVADVLERATARYQDCRTYADTGFAMTDLAVSVGQMRFRTAFVRPDRFRFEWEDQASFGAPVWESNGVWRHGPDVRSWFSFQSGVERDDGFGLAIAGATGVSMGLSSRIATLLLPSEFRGSYLTHMSDAELLVDGGVEGRECHRVRGGWGFRKDPIVVWIDVESSTIRRVDHETSGKGGSHIEHIAIYRPTLDGEIPPEDLELARPR